VDPFVTAPVAAGVLVGSMAGARLLGRVPARAIRAVFVVILVGTAVRMVWQGVGG